MPNSPEIKSGIRSVRYSSASEIADSENMFRLAIMGEFNGGEYLHDAATGAVGGAIAGGIFGEGVGAVPGAIVGGATNVVTHGLKDLWYGTRSSEDKASWQAGDAQEQLGNVSSILEKYDPVLAKVLTNLGTQYKTFIDGHIQKSSTPGFKDNRFNMTPAEQQQRFMQEYQLVQQMRQQASQQQQPGQPVPMLPKASNKKFVRVAQAPEVANSAAKGYLTYNGFSNPDSNGGGLGEAAAGMASGVGAYEGSNYIAKQALPDIMKNAVNPKNLSMLSNMKFMGWDLLGNLATNYVLNLAESLKGDTNLVNEYITALGKQITAINGFSNNDPAVVTAGNQIWTYLEHAKQVMQESQQKVQTEVQRRQQMPASQVPQPGFNGPNIPSNVFQGGPQSPPQQ